MSCVVVLHYNKPIYTLMRLDMITGLCKAVTFRENSKTFLQMCHGGGAAAFLKKHPCFAVVSLGAGVGFWADNFFTCCNLVQEHITVRLNYDVIEDIQQVLKDACEYPQFYHIAHQMLTRRVAVDDNHKMLVAAYAAAMEYMKNNNNNIVGAVNG